MPASKRHIIERLETYKDLFDNAHDLIHLVEPDGRILYVNRAWEKLLGYSQNDIEGKMIDAYVHEPDRARFMDYRRAVMKGMERNREIVVRLVTKDSDIVFVEGFVSSKSADGRAVYTRGIFRDITAKVKNEAELKLANVQLRESEANLQRLLFNAPDAIIVIDTQSKILYWNPKAEAVFGWRSDDVLGRDLAEVIIPAQYRVAHKEGMNRYLRTGKGRVLNTTVEVTALNKGNAEFYVALTISATIHNGIPAFIAFVRDIDEQKKNALELEQKKLQLEVSNRQLEQFAHIASHDMKEPIRKILLLIDLIQTDRQNTLSDRSRTHISRIEKSASRLASMVDGVLTHSSLKGESPQMERISLNEVIRTVESDLELSFQQKQAVVKFFNLPSIEGSPFLIYQLFYNLILNSLKFTKAEVKPVIEITASELSADTAVSYGLDKALQYYEIVLKDNGIGFQQAYAETIFEAFSRLHSKDSFEGTGLGLSLCKTIVEKHKGLIRAHGEENVGASFHILLPQSQKKS